MNCEEIQKLMMGYLDGELSAEQKRLVEKHLAECRKCRGEFDSFTQLEEVTGRVKLADLKEDIWAGYWKGVYRRIERGAGWIFLSVGAIILAALGAFQFFKSLFQAHVAHRGCHNLIGSQPSFFFHESALDKKGVISIQDLTIFIDPDGPVRISIVCDSYVGFDLFDIIREKIRMKGSALSIDVFSVGRGVDR